MPTVAVYLEYWHSGPGDGPFTVGTRLESKRVGLVDLPEGCTLRCLEVRGIGGERLVWVGAQDDVPDRAMLYAGGAGYVCQEPVR